jgi:chromosome partitioning protein
MQASQAIELSQAIQPTQVIQPELVEEARRLRRAFPPGLFGPLRFVITNQKGGQGKTTTTVELGAEFAASGRRVRLIDCDPQFAALTSWLLPQWAAAEQAARFDLSHVLSGTDPVPIDQATWPTSVENLYIVPSFKTVGGFDRLSPPGADFALREALDESGEHFDVTLIDCPPNLGQLTVSAITAGDDVIIPVLPGALDLMGVSDLNQTLALVKKRLNSSLNVAAVLLRRVRRTSFGEAVERQLLADYPEAIFQVIRHSVRAEEAPNEHTTILEYAPEATTTADYRELAYRLDERKAAEL